nr:ribonuclease H-like domain-containing protein [Tanacetum cinerariifolium]
MALIAEKTNVSRSKKKVVVSLDSKGSEADDFSELKKITALLAKAFNRRKFYSKPTNNNLRTSSSSQSANKKQEFVKTDNKKVEKKDDEKKRDMIRTVKMEQYLAYIDYALWEVILNGNGKVHVTKDKAGNEVEVPPVSAQQILARTRERKAKSNLLMAVPDEHLARFYRIKDAKTLWAAIETRFGESDGPLPLNGSLALCKNKRLAPA